MSAADTPIAALIFSMSTIQRHQSGVITAGEAQGGRFKTKARTAASGGVLGAPEVDPIAAELAALQRLQKEVEQRRLILHLTGIAQKVRERLPDASRIVLGYQSHEDQLRFGMVEDAAGRRVKVPDDLDDELDQAMELATIRPRQLKEERASDEYDMYFERVTFVSVDRMLQGFDRPESLDRAFA